jgi:hypothetical protein
MKLYIHLRKLCIVREYFLYTYIPPAEVADCSLLSRFSNTQKHVNRGWRPTPYRAEITRSLTNLRCNTRFAQQQINPEPIYLQLNILELFDEHVFCQFLLPDFAT